MKQFISLLFSALILVIAFTGCDLFLQGGTITIKNDTRENVSGYYSISDTYFSDYWELAAGRSWSQSVDKNREYSVSFPSYYDENNQYHKGEEKSGSLSGGKEVTLYVSSYVPGLEPLADYVQFDNSNPFPVTVYSDSAHQNKIADLAANGISPYLTDLSYYNRNAETHLYPIYHLFGVAEIPYNYDFINTVNIAKKTLLPKLSDLVPGEKDRKLTNYVYIIVSNDSTFSLVLTAGSSEIRPLGSSSSVLGSGKTGVYKVNAGGASSYQFMQNGISPVAFPSGLSNFSDGTLYAMRYSSSGLSWALNSSSSSFPISVSGALSYGR